MSDIVTDFKNSVISAFENYAQFEGRATRPQYWYFYLFIFLVNLVLKAVDFELLATLFALATLIPFLAVGARRLHDVNRSGWWQLLALTIIGLIPLIYWLVQPSATTTPTIEHTS